MKRQAKVVGTYIFRALLTILYIVIVLLILGLLNKYILQDSVKISEFMQGLIIGILMPPICNTSKVFENVE